MICSFNDLIGLPYKWAAKPEEGATDCLQLVGEARRRLGLYDYSEEFAWIYEKWEETSFPALQIVKWAREHGTKTAPRAGAIGYLKARQAGVALGVMVDDESFLFISPGGNATRTGSYNLPRIRLYWGKADAAM